LATELLEQRLECFVNRCRTRISSAILNVKVLDTQFAAGFATGMVFSFSVA